jgi:hypothetical protein
MSLKEPWRVIEEQGWRISLNNAAGYKEFMTSPYLWPRVDYLWRPDTVKRVGTGEEDPGEIFLFVLFALLVLYTVLAQRPAFVFGISIALSQTDL